MEVIEQTNEARGRQTSTNSVRHMELTISKKSLLRGLTRSNAAADRDSSMPILGNVLLTADDKEGALRFAATDLYLSVDTSSEAKVKRAGCIAIAARTLLDIVKNLPEGEVKLTVDKNYALLLTSGKIKFKVPGMPGDDFPPLPSRGSSPYARFPASLVAQLISLTQFSMSTDSTRPHLAGALFQYGDGRLRMVSTDGHRLSKAEAPFEADAPSFSLLVPGKGIAEVRKLIEDIRTDKSRAAAAATEGRVASPEAPMLGVATFGGTVFFSGHDVVLGVKLADEAFPPYEKVIPTNSTRRLVAARELLLSAVKRISLVSSAVSGGLRFTLEAGKLRIAGETDAGEGSEELDVDYPGDKLDIGFCARYLLDVLGAIPDDDVVIELGGELDPGVVRPAGATDFVGVIMPLRL